MQQKHGLSAWLVPSNRLQGVELNMTHSSCMIKVPSKHKLGHLLSQNRWQEINKSVFFSCHPNYISVSSQTCSSNAGGVFFSFRVLSHFILLNEKPRAFRKRIETDQLQDVRCTRGSDWPKESTLYPSDNSTLDWLDANAWNEEVYQENEQLVRSRLLA